MKVLSQLREALCFSQEEVAKQGGWDIEYLRDLEKEKEEFDTEDALIWL